MGAGTLLYGISGSYDAEVQDTVKIKIAYDHDSEVTDESQIVAMITAAEAATGKPVPLRRQRLGTTNLFARDFSFEQDANKKSRFYFDVTYRRPDGRERDATYDMHPLNYPPVVNIGYMERERIIEKAYNRDAVTGGGARAANTLGYVQNGAGVQAQTPILDTERIPVIIIRYNVATLAAVLSLNETYQDTTNNGTITIFGNSFAARTLKYQGTDVGDQQEFDDVVYFEAETRIEIHKTTDVSIDSVGMQEVTAGGKMLDIYQDDGRTPITEPIPITLDGTAGTPGVSVQMAYYYLTEVDYTPLLG